MNTSEPVSNPGSDEAVRQGCRCPILDNAHGVRPWWGGVWWIDEHCPLHGELKNGRLGFAAAR